MCMIYQFPGVTEYLSSAGGGFRKALKSFELGVSFACQYTHTQCSVLNNANDPECS